MFILILVSHLQRVNPLCIGHFPDKKNRRLWHIWRASNLMALLAEAPRLPGKWPNFLGCWIIMEFYQSITSERCFICMYTYMYTYTVYRYRYICTVCVSIYCVCVCVRLCVYLICIIWQMHPAMCSEVIQTASRRYQHIGMSIMSWDSRRFSSSYPQMNIDPAMSWSLED